MLEKPPHSKISYPSVATKDFKWDLRTNYSTYKTKVISLSNGVNSVNLQSNTQIGIFAEILSVVNNGMVTE